jgi:hypothetical protein
VPFWGARCAAWAVVKAPKKKGGAAGYIFELSSAQDIWSDLLFRSDTETLAKGLAVTLVRWYL